VTVSRVGSRRKTPVLRTKAMWIALALAYFSSLGLIFPVDASENVNQINFAHGRSSATVRGAVVRGERALYSVKARKGQRMSVRIVGPEKNVVFQVYGPGTSYKMTNTGLQITGDTLPGAGDADDAERWSGTLPRSGVYLLVVGTTRGNAAFQLTVSVR